MGGIDTGRTLPPTQPPGIAPGESSSLATPGAPIQRPSFLTAFLSQLPIALAGGLKPEPGAPFGTGLGGAMAGIQNYNQQNFQNTLAMRSQLAAEANAKSENALRTAQTNRSTQLLPYDVAAAKAESDKLLGLASLANNPFEIDRVFNSVASVLPNPSQNEQARLNSEKNVFVSNLRQGKFELGGVQSAIKELTQDRITKQGEPLGDVNAANQRLATLWSVNNPGKAFPTYMALQPGATQKDLDNAQKNLQELTTAQGVKAQREQAAATRAQTAALAQQKENETPVFAYDPAKNQTVYTNRGDARANRLTNIQKVSESDVDKEKVKAMQLGDAVTNITAYRVASREMDSLPFNEKTAIAKLIANDSFKAAFMGAELPVDWLNRLQDSHNLDSLSEPGKNAFVTYISARPAAITLLRAINPGVRLTESQIQTELKNIPDPTIPQDVREKMFTRLDRNIDQASKGLVKIPGMELPSEVRARVNAELGGESQTRQKAQADALANASGKYIDPKKSHTVGEEVIRAGKQWRITRIYPDKSFDMEED